jgi:uncharacterized protein involved in response to NO
MRMPGDVVFALGALLMAWDFVVKLRPLFPHFRRALYSGIGRPLGFRPFFLAAGLWSAAAVALWIVMFATGAAVPSRFDPLAWHIHQMLFGFVMAAIAGFLLTAIPNWTGRQPVKGGMLARLAGFWLLGRIRS